MAIIHNIRFLYKESGLNEDEYHEYCKWLLERYDAVEFVLNQEQLLFIFDFNDFGSVTVCEKYLTPKDYHFNYLTYDIVNKIYNDLLNCVTIDNSYYVKDYDGDGYVAVYYDVIDSNFIVRSKYCGTEYHRILTFKTKYELILFFAMYLNFFKKCVSK